MTKLRNILVAADPIRHEEQPTHLQRDRVRHAILAAASGPDAAAGHAPRSLPFQYSPPLLSSA